MFLVETRQEDVSRMLRKCAKDTLLGTMDAYVRNGHVGERGWSEYVA